MRTTTPKSRARKICPSRPPRCTAKFALYTSIPALSNISPPNLRPTTVISHASPTHPQNRTISHHVLQNRKRCVTFSSSTHILGLMQPRDSAPFISSRFPLSTTSSHLTSSPPLQTNFSLLHPHTHLTTSAHDHTPASMSIVEPRSVPDPQVVLDFWYSELKPMNWFVKNDEIDAIIRARFEPLVQQAALGELFSWRSSPEGRLAEIIVLDQFPRNIYRGTAQSFQYDTIALVLAQEAVACGDIDKLDDSNPFLRGFLLMPYMHSESPLVHVQAEILFERYGSAANIEYEKKHKVIIDRFGRYPHRNEVLGRASTDEEIDFLAGPDSSF